MKKIGIVVAKQIEGADFIQKLGKPQLIDLYKGFRVEKFEFSNKEIYFVESGMGEINAAMATQLLIDRCGIDEIINFGVVGGLNHGMRGKVCCVTGVAHYDYDISELDGYPRGRYEEFDSIVLPTDKEFFDVIKSVVPKAQEVVCASGDKFVTNEAFKEGLRKDFDASICDMESAGIIITAKRSEIPCGIIKIVSDDGDHYDEYYDFLASMKDEFSSIIIPLLEKI